MYSTDNGAAHETAGARMPGMDPFRTREELSQLEGATGTRDGARPGHIEPAACSPGSSAILDVAAHRLLARAGEPDIKQKWLRGSPRWAARPFKVHLDGYNMLGLWTGKTDTSPGWITSTSLMIGDLHRPAFMTTGSSCVHGSRRCHRERCRSG